MFENECKFGDSRLPNGSNVTKEEKHILPIDDESGHDLDQTNLNRKRRRGQNKRKERINQCMLNTRKENDICKNFINIDGSLKKLTADELLELNCQCSKIHSVNEYLKKKTKLTGPCVNYEKYNYCRYGSRCLFSDNHTKIITEFTSDGDQVPVSTVEITKPGCSQIPLDYKYVSRDFKKSIRISSLDLPKTKQINILLQKLKEVRKEPIKNHIPLLKTALEECVATNNEQVTPICNFSSSLQDELIKSKEILGDISINVGTLVLSNDYKKRLNLSGKTYLAPLTTVGNLPFRRICKELGADVTCSEMAMCNKLLQGNDHEWALLRKHSSEDICGAQICCGTPELAASCAEMIQKAELGFDFIDLNFGCPLPVVTKYNSGSALLANKRRLLDIVSATNLATSIPVTVKMRTGISLSKPLALPIISQLKQIGVNVVSLHGRSKEQRYTKLADWDYIKECSAIANTGEEKLQLFGNGDVLSYDEYYKHLDDDENLAGVMIGRGALVKPWIFTEIKERRHWDISSRERLDLLRKLCSYGLEYWGTDTIGLDTNRRMLCEWQSFMCRYVPVGLFEGGIPQKINTRFEKINARDEIESLMASPLSEDWVKLSELILGKAPDHFKFIPKHKSSGSIYSDQIEG